jgi:hypothetical protein
MPAKTAPAEPETIGVKDLPEHIRTDARALRALLRRSKRAVGRGTRYEWKSLTDPEPTKVIADWMASPEKDQPTAANGTSSSQLRDGLCRVGQSRLRGREVSGVQTLMGRWGRLFPSWRSRGLDRDRPRRAAGERTQATRVALAHTGRTPAWEIAGRGGMTQTKKPLS